MDNRNRNERNLAIAMGAVILFMLGITPILLKFISKGDVKGAILFLGGSLGIFIIRFLIVNLFLFGVFAFIKKSR